MTTNTDFSRLDIDYRLRRLTKEEVAHRDELATRGLKVCCKCRKEMPFDRFSRCKATRDGMSHQCKGCASLYYQRSKKTHTFVSADLSALRKAAEDRGLEFSLQSDGLRRWWQNTPEVCVFCGQGADEVGRIVEVVVRDQGKSRFLSNVAAKIRWAYKRKSPVRRLTIDRKDNEAGYTLDNIQKCCFICNSLKGALLTDDEMAYLAPRLWARIRAACSP